MANSKNLPTDYVQYLRLAKRTYKNQALPYLNRFAFRYRLAVSFKEIIAPEVGKTLVGYNTLTKIFLAYTAFEAVTKACKVLRVNGLTYLPEIVILEPKLAKKIQTNIALKSYLLSSRFNIDLNNKLNLFYNDSIGDVSAIAFALRNVYAHGDLTASVVGAEKAKHRKNLDELATKILEFSDDAFSRCIARL
jgi:hypothetical protein